MSERRRKGGTRRQRKRRDRQVAVTAALPPIESEWIYYGDQRMLVVGYTSNGTPFGYVEEVGPGYADE